MKTTAKNGPLPEFRILDAAPPPDRNFGIQKASHPGPYLSVREPLAVMPCRLTTHPGPFPRQEGDKS